MTEAEQLHRVAGWLIQIQPGPHVPPHYAIMLAHKVLVEAAQSQSKPDDMDYDAKRGMPSMADRFETWRKHAHAEHMQRLGEITELLKDIASGLA